MPKYESTNRAIHNYQRQHYDQMVIKAPKGAKDALKAKAAEAGVSLNRYVLESVEQRSGLKLTLDNDLPWMTEEK